MCMQCCTKSELYGTGGDCEVLPGWYLVRATVTAYGWNAGEWGLVRSNDPDFIWSGKLTKSSKSVISFLECLATNRPMTVFHLIESAEKVGFKIERDENGVILTVSRELGEFLLDRFAKWVKTHPVWKDGGANAVLDS